MPELVIILYSAGDETHATLLVDAVQGFGYEVWHTGLTSVGDIELKELSDRIAKGGPILVCGTARAAGSKWLRKILAHVQGQNALGKPRVFPVRLEIDADLEAVGLSVQVAECFPDFAAGISKLRDGLIKHYPLATTVGPSIQVTKAFLGDHPHLKYDRRPVLAHGVEALNHEAIQRFLAMPLSRRLLQKAGIGPDDVRHSIVERLNALGCICDGHPTLGAFLCFARRELLIDKFGGCSLQMVIFDHTKRALSAPSIELAQDNLLTLHEEGMSWFGKEAGLRRQGRVGRAERDDLEIPETVLHEAFANALVHRDYESGDIREQPTRLDVFPDRVEITSFGNLPEAVPLESLNGDSDEAIYWRRNPVIAQIFLLMSRAELNASGVSRMRTAMERASLAFPRFVANLHQSVVRVVLQRPAKVDEGMGLVTPPLAARRGQLRVMLGGTVCDLAEHRKQAAVACLRLGMFPILADDLPAHGEEAISAVMKMVDDADVFIGIYGWRYGAVLKGESISVSELEFNKAVERGIPMLVFMMHEDHPVTRGMLEEDVRASAKLAAFKERMGKNGIYQLFKSPEELRSQILVTLAKMPVPERARGYSCDFKADISRIAKYAPTELIGREMETKLLSDAWQKAVRGEKNSPHVLTFVALGGEGKTSLVAKWVAELAHQDWQGCDAVFAWSFYSQGSRDQTTASSDTFLREALTFFGDAAMAGSAQSAFDKGGRLAQLVGERRALLILDGLEPLQYAPTSPMPGELKDQGLAALLKGLAATNQGLCVITTACSIPDLRAYRQTTAPEVKLSQLSKEAGMALLRSLGVKGTRQEFEMLVDDMNGHALTLNLIGSYLRDAHGGDIRQRDRVKLAEADAEEQGGHAFRVMDAYVKALEQEETETTEEKTKASVSSVSSSSKGQRALSILRLLALFDRPATADCLEALWTAPAIAGLTEPLVGLSEAQRNMALTRLESAKLVAVNRDAAGGLVSLDAHPLLREYFARAVRSPGFSRSGAAEPPKGGTTSEAWRIAHRRLYEHLCATTKEGDQPTLEDLQPLYQAVAHGCQAELQQEVCEGVFRHRIQRGHEAYSTKELGAFGSDLGAVACFFETPWSRVSPALKETDQAWLLNQAAFRLRALGRLTEALEPMRAGVGGAVRLKDWDNAARYASNLSELELTLGEVAGAVKDAEQSVTYAHRSGYAGMRMVMRTTHADALNQAGRRAEAQARFREAEALQKEAQPDYPLLYSLRGFQYCDLLLTEAERAAWRRQCRAGVSPAGSPGVAPGGTGGGTALEPAAGTAALLESCHAVEQRAAQTLKWVTAARLGLLTIALEHLTLGRAALYATILEGRAGSSQAATPERSEDTVTFATARRELDAAVAGLRRAGQLVDLPRGLLTRAWLRSLSGARTGPESAQSDLDEAWEIAERGPMPLFLADIHLHRARLFGRGSGVISNQLSVINGEKYSWDKHPDGSPRGPKDDLAEARRLIYKHGYLRRKEELEDAEQALGVRPGGE